MQGAAVSPKPGRSVKSRGKKKKSTKLTNCGFRRHSPTIPPIIEQTCLYLEQHALQHEGLFRISGSQEGIRQIKDRFEKGKKVDLNKELNPNTIAGILKLFFTELENPIMTYELYPSLISAISVTEPEIRVWCLRQVLDVMPPGNREVIRRITAMFRTISGYSEINKMNARNIALVMNPALFRDPVGSMRDFVKNGGIRVRLVEMFITNHNDIFLLPREELDERIRGLEDGISKETEEHLLGFSQTLQQNAISLATALMSEGETELVVCFENFNNIKKSIDAWRTGGTENEDTEPEVKLRKRSRTNAVDDVPKQSKPRRKVGSDSFQLETESTNMYSSVDSLQVEKISVTDRSLTEPAKEETEERVIPSLTPEIRLRKRSHSRIKQRRCREIDGSTEGNTKQDSTDAANEAIDSPLSQQISPRSSVRLFFDARDTNALARESNINIGQLFQAIVDGKADKIREELDSATPEARFLLIFRLQRAARDFIVALDECK